MTKILAVFGATGQQGSSVIDYVLSDPELSRQYNIRAITRNVDSDQARQLQAKVQVVQGDVSDPASLETALTDAHTVFAMTVPSFSPDGLKIEYDSGKAIADAAVKKGAKYIIFSTLPPVNEMSGGKYTQVIHFDAKAKVEQYIRSLDIKSAFYSPCVFMQNFHNIPFLGPQPAADGTWVMARHNSPQSLLPVIDAVADTGKFIGAILAQPDKYAGQTFCAASAVHTLDEVAAILAKATGKKVVYKQISPEEWKQSLPMAQDILFEAFSFGEEFGYYGPGSEKSMAWAAENARGRLTTFEEYLEAHPLQLA